MFVLHFQWVVLNSSSCVGCELEYKALENWPVDYNKYRNWYVMGSGSRNDWKGWELTGQKWILVVIDHWTVDCLFSVSIMWYLCDFQWLWVKFVCSSADVKLMLSLMLLTVFSVSHVHDKSVFTYLYVRNMSCFLQLKSFHPHLNLSEPLLFFYSHNIRDY